MNELALFAGGGGGILGGILVGWRTVCAVEIDAYCRKILLARQRDGILPRFPIWDDVRTFDGTKWRGVVDVISGGFPCQDISCAGKGAGINGERSGLWVEFARIIGEVGPRYVFVENVSALLVRGMGRVLGDLAEMGYDARWGVLGARDVGAPHRRERIWIVADAGHGREFDGTRSSRLEGRERPSIWGEFGANGKIVSDAGGGRCEQCDAGERRVPVVDEGGSDASDINGERLREGKQRENIQEPGRSGCVDFGLQQEMGRVFSDSDSKQEGRASISWGKCCWWESEPGVGRVADGVASRVDRLRALGNGQVPGVAALAWRILQ